MTKEDFLEKMKEQSDEQLKNIIGKEHDSYEPEAVEAAKEVLTSRGVDFEETCDNDSTVEGVEICLAEKAYASFGKRIGEYLIDMFTLSFLGYIYGYVWGSIDPYYYSRDENITVITILIFIVYYFGMEAACGRTVGKFFTGTKIVDRDGNKPSVRSVLGRTLCRFIPFDGFSFLFWDWEDHKLKGCWHDSLPKIYVADIEKLDK